MRRRKTVSTFTICKSAFFIKINPQIYFKLNKSAFIKNKSACCMYVDVFLGIGKDYLVVSKTNFAKGAILALFNVKVFPFTE